MDLVDYVCLNHNYDREPSWLRNKLGWNLALKMHSNPNFRNKINEIFLILLISIFLHEEKLHHLYFSEYDAKSLKWSVMGCSTIIGLLMDVKYCLWMQCPQCELKSARELLDVPFTWMSDRLWCWTNQMDDTIRDVDDIIQNGDKGLSNNCVNAYTENQFTFTPAVWSRLRATLEP